MYNRKDWCKNNPENSSSTKVSENILSSFSMYTILPFANIENKHDAYRGKDCMKKFCQSLSKNRMKILILKRKKIELLTKEHQKTYKNGRICYICQEKFENKYLKDKKYCMVRDHFNYTRENRGAVHSICTPKKI